MKTATKSKITLVAMAFLGASAIGWMTAPTDQKPMSDEPIPKKSVSRERGLRNVNSATHEISRKMKSIREGVTQQERIRASISLAMSLPASEFAAWAAGDRFDFRAGPELNIFRMILFERWIAEDPDSLIGFAVENDHGQARRGLDTLLKNDPERVLGYFRAHPNDSFELRKLKTLAENEPSLVLARLAEMSARGVIAAVGAQSESLFLELAGKHYTLLEATLESLSPVLQQKAETALSGVRLEAGFQTEIRNLWERPDGWDMFAASLQRNPKLAAKFIEELAAMPVSWKKSFAGYSYYAVNGENAKKWLEMDLGSIGFNKLDVDRIRTRAAEQLVGKDPKFVLSILDSLNLGKDQKGNFFTRMFELDGNTPEKAEKLIAMLGTEEERISARERLELKNFRDGKGMQREPSDWIAALGSGNSASSNSYYFTSEVSRWDERQVSEFRDGFNGLATAERRKVALALASRADDVGGNESLTSDAINYLVRNPMAQDKRQGMSEDPTMMAAQFALKLASKDLSAASSWIDTLPAGDASMWARRNVAKDLQQYDPAAVRGWMKTLPAAERKDVEGYLQGNE